MDVRSKYHLVLDGTGFMLRGAPNSPRYIKEDAPTEVNQLGTGDLSYNKLNGSGWSFFAQTDWSGGFQKIKYEDKANFRDGFGIDVLSEYGNIKLQKRFTSGVSISGGHSYGAHEVHDGTMILGTVKAGAAKVFKITSGNALSTLSAYAGISAINSMSKFNGNTLIGMTRTSGTFKTLAVYNGSAVSGFKSTNPTVRAVKGIGIRAYISERVAALSGDVLSYATNLSAFTSAYQAGKNRKITNIEDLSGTPYFFIQENDVVEFFKWDELAEKAYPIYTWQNLTNFGVTRYLSFVIITGTSNGKSVAFAFNGARLFQIFEDQLSDSSYDFSKPFEYQSNLQTKGAQWDGEFWSPGYYGKYGTVQYTPFANFANRVYGYAVTGSIMRVDHTHDTQYELSGQVDSSEFGHDIGAIDKLVNSVSINTEALATGQAVQILKSTNNTSSFSSIGSMSFATDGAIKSKRLYLPSGTVTKLWNYRIKLTGPGTSTPTVKDIAFEYRPVPNLKKRWAISIDSGDNIELLNNQEEERKGKAVMAELWSKREAKQTMVFKDVNSFETGLVSAFTSAMTSALIDTSRLMPPKGRMRIKTSGVIEEMSYTSADGNTIKGISRGQKGTKAADYTSAHTIDNFNDVVITDIKEQINNTDQNKTESIAQLTLLEV